jgi:acetyltransferase-like isoleucine patch superfamily enzyme
MLGVDLTTDRPARSRRGSWFLSSYRALCRVRDKGFSVLASRAFAAYGPHSVIQLPVRLSGESRIAVGADVFIGGGSWLQVLQGEGDTPVISIGDGTSIAGTCVLSAVQRITLGRRVLMARNVYIADHMHAFEQVGHAVLDQGIDRVGRVEIGDGAWLGQNVVVGPGVRIGRGAVIGANSVVLDDVPDHSVAVGAPARTIRSLVDVNSEAP